MTPLRVGTCKDCGSNAELFKGSRCLMCKRVVDNERVKKWNANNQERCKATSREQYAKHSERRKSYSTRWRAANPDKTAAQRFRHNEKRRRLLKTSPEFKRRVFAQHLRSEFRIDLERFDSMIVAQFGRCCICPRPLSAGKNGVHVDHDHVTGEVRGLLCSQCNVGLGMFRDSPDLLESAARYLCEHRPVLRLVR